MLRSNMDTDACNRCIARRVRTDRPPSPCNQAKKGGLKALLPFAAPAISLNVGLKNNGSATFTGIVEKDACLKTIVAAAKERGVTLG